MQHLNTREDLLTTMQELRADLDAVIGQVDEERAVEPGAFGEWSFKDLIAHLTGWRVVTAARLEAGLSHTEPVFPWPPQLEEGVDPDEGDVDEINRWFFEANRDKPLTVVVAESNAAFDRVERAIAIMPEEDLLTSGRFAWPNWPPDIALGPGVVRGTYDHYHVDHEPDIRAWLARN
jgi:hypothetical protein